MLHMETMFDTLLQLPLFQGLTHEDFTAILAKVKLHFTRHKSGDLLCASGEPCSQLLFLLRGEATLTTPHESGLYALAEQIQAPYLVEPYSLFGMSTHYQSSCHALGEAHTVSIEKSFLTNDLFKYEIFRLNYMNMVCNRAQTLSTRLQTLPAGSIKERFIHFLLTRCERPIGAKTLKIKMEQLALILNESRMSTSKMLNDLQEQGLVSLRRGEIYIPRAENL